ncbi:MAG TPA: hypothetical protein VEG42_04815 [Thermoplasmata archaeon]|nr:hypothetical protein [Thermoplasmata archaeon]
MSAANPPTRPVPESAPYKVPSLGYRILMAGFRVVISFVVLIALPVAALAFVRSRGIPIPVPIEAVTAWGIVLIVLSAARYVLKPTAAYGPLSIAVSGVFLAYLYYLVLLSPYQFVLPGGTASIAAGYSLFLEALMIVPVMEIIAGVLTTIEDLAWPKERLPFDYPV